MSIHFTSTEAVPSVATFSLRQFFNWLSKREAVCARAWELASGPLKEVLVLEAHEFHQGGGYHGMTPLKFYMMDDFLKDIPDGNKFYWTVVGAMRLPFNMWDHVVVDVPTCKLHLLDSGKLLYEQWCAANHLQPV